MKKLSKFLAIIALVSIIGTAEAQNVSPVDFMRYNPYQMNTNPAADLPYESVMSLVIGNIGVNLQNTTLRYDNLFEFDEQGRPALINLRQLANSVKKNNFLGVDAQVDFFTLFRRTNYGIITFNYGVKAKYIKELLDNPHVK